MIQITSIIRNNIHCLNMSSYTKIQNLSAQIILLSLLHYFAIAQETTTTVSTTNNVRKIELKDDEKHTWTSFNYPEPYPATASEDLLVTADKGYSIAVVIEDVDIDGFNGDFLVMKPGMSLEGEDKGKVFTFSVKTSPKYAVHTNSVYFRFKVVSENSNQKKGFKLYYQRVGEVVTLTTTEAPNTEMTWPTPSGSESVYYTGFIHGKNQKDFVDNQTLTNLNTALSEMAKKYCEFNNIVTTQNITERNVKINYIVECPQTWPESEVCVKVRFGIPILYQKDALWNGYQLNADNLEIMWNQYGDDYLKTYNMKVYKEPDNKFAFRKWIIIFCIILILFLIVLIAIKCIFRYISKHEDKKHTLRDLGSIMSQPPRNSKVSLTPHPNQVTPPLFENDYSFNTYDPDDAISRANHNLSMGTQNFSYLESDDDSDIDVYNPNFSGSQHNDARDINRETKT